MAPAQDTFPDDPNTPTVVQQDLSYFGVITAVSRYLFGPEVTARSRQPKQRTVMPVPETTVYKNYGTQSWKHNVWFAGEIAAVDAKPKTFLVQQTANHLLRFCVASTDPRHHPATCGTIYNIDHGLL
jgi:hypothetical protein